MKPDPGIYALILKNRSKARVQIGRWREIEIAPGYYIYVGSAFGPGGVRARVLRHCRMDKPKHWHIDYLREFVTPVAAWISYETERLEHQWAHTLYGMSGMTPIQGFGCSDCECFSHFFHSSTAPDLGLFSKIVDSKLEIWPQQPVR